MSSDNSKSLKPAGPRRHRKSKSDERTYRKSKSRENKSRSIDMKTRDQHSKSKEKV